LGNFFSGDYATQNVSALYNKRRFYDDQSIKIIAWSASGMDKPTFEEALEGLKGDKARTIKRGYVFGPSWTNHWLQIHITIPEEFQQANQPVICKCISAILC
jgi:alpha-mannosidase